MKSWLIIAMIVGDKQLKPDHHQMEQCIKIPASAGQLSVQAQAQVFSLS